MLWVEAADEVVPSPGLAEGGVCVRVAAQADDRLVTTAEGMDADDGTFNTGRDWRGGNERS